MAVRPAGGRRGRLLWLLPLACLLACGGAERRIYDVRGVVRDVQRDYEQVLVEHEDIPGLMPAMTMNFAVADPALLERLEPGQVIRFRLEVTRRSYSILEASVLETSSGPDGPGLRLGDAIGAAESAPPFRLTDQQGKLVSLEDLSGRAVLLDFVYTRCPGPCPILTGIHVEAQRTLPEDLRARAWFVSITLDPAYDTPEALRGYAEARGADLAGWSFLTGSPEEVEAVIESYGVARMPSAEGELEHMVVTFVIDSEGRIARRFIGLDHEPEELVRALRSAAG